MDTLGIKQVEYIKVEGNYYKGPVIDNKMRCINPVYYKKEEIKTNSSKAEVNKVFWGTGGLQKDSIKSEHFVENYNVRVFSRVLKMR